MSRSKTTLLTVLALGAGTSIAVADESAPTPPAPAAAPATVTLSTPSMAGPLTQNPNPYTLDVGPLGKWYVTGVVSGLGLLQNSAVPGDRYALGDLSNGEIIIQKTEGIVQFYLQAGAYTLPSLGTAYVPLDRSFGDFYTAVPQAFLKIAPTDQLSIEAGRLPTLLGAEYTFTFENINIERGLLWNQENVINRGVQVNYTIGPVALSVSLNDGFYSDRFNWLTGSAAWTINSANTVSITAGGNFGHTDYSRFQTPLNQNNGQIYDLIYTYSSAPWTVTPYLQATVVPTNAAAGISQGANTYGAAVLANYAFTPRFSLGGRAEYILSTGSQSDGAANLLYGPGSKAWSLTVTPTYQYNRLFIRADAAYVRAASVAPGLGFGRSGTARDQVRGLVETGILF